MSAPEVPANVEDNPGDEIRKKADAIFAEQINSTYCQTDRSFAYLLVIQWVGAIILSLVVSPRVWSGTMSQPHIHLYASVLLGGAIVALPLFLIFTQPGKVLTRHVVSAAQILMSVLLIHITGGRIETHFHVFGSLAFLAFYRDWRVLITASTIVAVDHILRGIYWPQSVYGVTQIQPWRWVEHAAWIAFEDAFLIVAIKQSLREMHHIAVQRAGLELAHQQVVEKSERLEKSEVALSEKLHVALENLLTARDAAVESSRLKSEFLANMSHEIRTPLNAVIGMADILYRNAKGKIEKQRLEVIRDAGNGLLTLIGDTLDFSKIEAGKVVLELGDVDIRASVEGAAEILGAQARARGIALLTFVDPNIPRSVYGDAGRLRQVLINLIGNGIKFTEIGHVVIKALLQSRDENSCTIEFQIQDTGIGLAQTEIEKLFNPFVQADGTSTRKFGGTGLGLSICKRLVEMMGGSIGVESSPGKGSLFHFTLRFDCSETGSSPQKLPLEELDGKRVLVVDDDPVCCGILGQYLEQWSIENRCTTSAEKAMELLQEGAASGKPFDIALLDLFIPGMDALQLRKEMESFPEIALTDLILVTAFDRPGLGRQALKTGFRAYLRKPIKQEELVQALLAAASKEQLNGPDRKEMAIASGALPAHEIAEYSGLVLLCEDNAANQMVAQIQLSELGLSTHIAGTGIEAVQAVSENQYQLILMDCMMPEMDGFQATAEIRKMELTTGRHVPVIAMTAKALSGDREKCLAAGMDDYLCKPVELEQLRIVLSKWLPQMQLTAAESSQKEIQHTSDLKLDSKLIDLERLVANVGEDALEPLFKLQVEQMTDSVDKLDKFVSAKDAASIHAQAHKLKGGASSLYCYKVEAICAALEKHAMAEDWKQISSSITELLEAFEQVKYVLNTVLPVRHKRR